MIRFMLVIGAAVAAIPFVDLRDRPAGVDIAACLPDAAGRTWCGGGDRRKSLSAPEMSLVVRTLLGEAARQPDDEVRAIAQVIFNRLESGRWGNSVADVVLYQSGGTYAFTAFDPRYGSARNVWDLSPTHPEWKRLWRIASQAWQDRADDPTDGAVHYYHPKAMVPAGRTPWWAKDRPTVTIGDAVFVTKETRK